MSSASQSKHSCKEFSSITLQNYAKQPSFSETCGELHKPMDVPEQSSYALVLCSSFSWWFCTELHLHEEHEGLEEIKDSIYTCRCPQKSWCVPALLAHCWEPWGVRASGGAFVPRSVVTLVTGFSCFVPRIKQLPRGFHGQRERISPCAEPIFIDPTMQGASSRACESPAREGC